MRPGVYQNKLLCRWAKGWAEGGGGGAAARDCFLTWWRVDCVSPGHTNVIASAAITMCSAAAAAAAAVPSTAAVASYLMAPHPALVKVTTRMCPPVRIPRELKREPDPPRARV